MEFNPTFVTPDGEEVDIPDEMSQNNQTELNTDNTESDKQETSKSLYEKEFTPTEYPLTPNGVLCRECGKEYADEEAASECEASDIRELADHLKNISDQKQLSLTGIRRSCQFSPQF